MTSLHRAICKRKEQGSAAVEFVIVFFPLMTLLVFSLFLGRLFWSYSVAQKAAHDAVRYLAAVSSSEAARAPVGREKPAAAIARTIVERETADLNPGPYGVQISVLCDGVECNRPGPFKSARVTVSMNLIDDFFSDWTGSLAGPYGILLVADVTAPYVGN